MEPLKNIFERQDSARDKMMNTDKKNQTGSAYIKFEIDDHLFATEISKIREVVDSWKLTVYPELCHGHLGIVNIRGQILPVINPFNHSVTQTAPLPGERLIILEGPSKDGFCVVVKQVQKVVLDSENPDQNSTVNINGRPVKIVTEPDLYEYFGVQ
jgi:chemotaxis signal transduction protein